MKRVRSYDVKCFELAEAFLSDKPTLDTAAARDELAGDIQQAIEDWFFMNRPKVSQEEAREYVRKEQERNANRDKPISAARDGFINDYD